MTKYVVKLDNKFIKHTSKFGPFYGSIVVTINKSEARLFSRRPDAEALASVAAWRIHNYEDDKKKFPDFKVSYVEPIEV